VAVMYGSVCVSNIVVYTGFGSSALRAYTRSRAADIVKEMYLVVVEYMLFARAEEWTTP